MDEQSQSQIVAPMNPVELPKAVDLFKHAWVIFKSKVKTFLFIQIVPFLVAIPIGLIGGYFDKRTADVDFTSGAAITPEQWTAMLVMVLAVLAGLVIQTWAQIATIIAIRDRESDISPKEAFRQAIGMIFAYWWVYFLVMLAVIGGFILLIVPGIIFGIWYSFTGYTLVMEGKKGTEALAASKAYVKGRTGQVVYKFLFIGLITIAVFGIPSVILEAMKLEALGAAYTSLAALIMYPVGAIYQYLIYDYLKKSKSNVV